jgi:hypothetical protein
LLLLNESIDPQGRRHILNLTFLVARRGGVLRLNPDRRLKDAVWIKRRDLMNLEFYPEIRRALLAAWKRDFKVPAAWVKTPWR